MEDGSGELVKIKIMKIIESRIGIVQKPDVKVFNFLSDFTNFADLIQSGKVKNWTATKDSCSFKIDRIGQTGLKILEKTPNSMIKISSDGITPADFLFWIKIDSKGTNSCEVKITIEPDVNPLIMTMIRSPLQGFVDKLIEQLEKMKI